MLFRSRDRRIPKINLPPAKGALVRSRLSGRITRLNFSDRTAENNFKADIEKMYEIYGIEDNTADSGGESDDIQ